MKPKYKQTLNQLIKYYHTEYSDYTVQIYITGKLKFNDSIQLAYNFGYENLNVIEFFRNDNKKTITIYTNDSNYNI